MHGCQLHGAGADHEGYSCVCFVCRVAWPAVMKGWEQWRDVYSAEGQLLFAGLRAKVSVFHGQMTRIVPHTTTGDHSQWQTTLQEVERPAACVAKHCCYAAIKVQDACSF